MSFDDLPRSPSGRVPQWVVDEARDRAAPPPTWRGATYDTSAAADGGRAEPGAFPVSPTAPLEAGVGHSPPWQAPRRAPREAARTPRRSRASVAVVALSGMLGLAWVGVWVSELPEVSWDAVLAELGKRPVRLDDLDGTGHVLPFEPASDPGGRPPPGVEEEAAPLGVPAPVEWDGSPYAFSKLQELPDGTLVPVTWSPCRPVHYVVNTAGAPVGFEDDVATVVAELAEATGFVFVDDGTTSESAGTDRALYQPERYGERWAPLLVQFSDETVLPRLEADVAGVAGPLLVRRPDGLMVAVSGTVWLDSTLLRKQPVGAEPTHVGVLRHELAHALGLDHVEDETQLMNPVLADAATFQSGDRYGLSQLSRGVCAPDA